MPKVVDRAEQRDSLAEACLQLFATKGFAAVTMRELAAANAVSTGMFYHYFPNKRSILAHIFATSAARDLGALARTLPADADAPMRRAALLAFLEAGEARLRHLVLVAIDVHRLQAQGALEDDHGLVGVAHAYMEAIGGWLDLDAPARERTLRAIIGGLLHRAVQPHSGPISAHILSI
jgi:AcrR family transcriptional regulator